MAEEKNISALVAMLTEGHVELRQDMKDIGGKIERVTDSLHEIAIANKELIVEFKGTSREVAILREEIYGKEFGILTRLSKQETEQSNDKLRWGVLVSITLIVLGGIGGLWSTVVKPTQDAAKIIADAQASNDEVIEKLDTNNDNLKNIFELMIKNYEAQDETNN